MSQGHSHLYSEICKADDKSREQILETLAREPIAYSRRAAEISEKVTGKGVGILLDNPETKSLRKRKQAIPPSNIMKNKARMEISKDALKNLTFAHFQPLNKLWEGYMKDLFGITQKNNLENAMARADYHGSFLRVVQAKCPSTVGISGIVVQETMNTFVIMKNNNTPVVIPKGGSVFSCSLETQNSSPIEWHLFGDQLKQQSGIRSSKKFKSKPSVTL